MYFKMGEVTKLVGVQAHVLRYWEKEIPAIRPGHSSANQRRYRRRDVELFREVKRLLYEERFTLAGAKKHLSNPMAPPEMLPGNNASDFDAHPKPNDLNASIAEHDMYSPNLLQQMQQTLTKTLNDLTTTIAEHDTSGPNLLQELHDAITKTATANPVTPPWTQGPAPTPADAIDALRASQVAAPSAAQSETPITASADGFLPDAMDKALSELGDGAECDDGTVPTPLVDEADDDDDTETDDTDDAHAEAAADTGDTLSLEPEHGASDQDEAETDTEGLPAAYTWEGADAADHQRTPNEGEDAMAASSSDDERSVDHDSHAMHADSEQEAQHDSENVSEHDSENELETYAYADAELIADEDDPEDDTADDNKYVLYRTEATDDGPDVAYGAPDVAQAPSVTQAPDVAYASGDADEQPAVAYVSGETGMTPDVSYSVGDAPDAFDVAHASGEADAAFNTFQPQDDGSASIEVPCLSPQASVVPDIAYASGLYATPELSSEELGIGGVGGVSGLPMAAFAAHVRGDGHDTGHGSPGGWGAPSESWQGMYGTATIAAQLPAGCYGADDRLGSDDGDDVDGADHMDGADGAEDRGSSEGLQAASNMDRAAMERSAFRAWDTEGTFNEQSFDISAADELLDHGADHSPDHGANHAASAVSDDATETGWNSATATADMASRADAAESVEGIEGIEDADTHDIFDDLQDSPYAAFLSSATPEAASAVPNPTVSDEFEADDPAVLAAWDALAATQAPPESPAITREATDAAGASLEAARRQVLDDEPEHVPTPAPLGGRMGAAASFEEGEEPAGGFYAYVETPAEGVPSVSPENEAHARAHEAFYPSPEAQVDTRAPGPEQHAPPAPIAALPAGIDEAWVTPADAVATANHAPASPATPTIPPPREASHTPIAEPAQISGTWPMPASPVAQASDASVVAPPAIAQAMVEQAPASPSAQAVATHAEQAIEAPISAPKPPLFGNAVPTPDAPPAALSPPPLPTALVNASPAPALPAPPPLPTAFVAAAPEPAVPAPIVPPPLPIATAKPTATAAPAPAIPAPVVPPPLPTATASAAPAAAAAPTVPEPAVPEPMAPPAISPSRIAFAQALKSLADTCETSSAARATHVLSAPPPAARATHSGADTIAPPVVGMGGGSSPREDALHTIAGADYGMNLSPDDLAHARETSAPATGTINAPPPPASERGLLEGRSLTAAAEAMAVAAQAMASVARQSEAAAGTDPEDVRTDADAATATPPAAATALTGEDLLHAAASTSAAPSLASLVHAEMAAEPQPAPVTAPASASASVTAPASVLPEPTLAAANENAAPAIATATATDVVPASAAAQVPAPAAAQDAAPPAAALEEKSPAPPPTIPAENTPPAAPATPPVFEHPPYFETPTQDTLAVQLLRQKLRSGLQDILRIATE